MEFSDSNVTAYFQPILCAASNQIYSYEVLGRYIDEDGTVKSLGAFFMDARTTNDEALRVDRIIRRKAMERYVRENRIEYLFINIRLAWLENYIDRPHELPTIQWARELGIDPGKIVIEFTEEEFTADDSQQAAAHLNILSYYRNAGCRIALDDYGKSASNIDRLALLKPDIIKINIDYIHNSETSYHYREHLRSLAGFAESVGIEVLYEGIETQRQLEICMFSNGRLYQGYLISYPQASMVNAVVNHDVFSAAANNTYKKQYKRIMNNDLLESYLDSKVGYFLIENPSFYENDDIDIYLTDLCYELPEVVRIYLCDKHGKQITCNFEWSFGELKHSGYLGNNWALRGFFYEAMEMFISGKKSGLTSSYRDFTTKNRIFTYFHALTPDIFLFVDINNIFYITYKGEYMEQEQVCSVKDR
ncbi:MAG: EAL domain-containing protein [Treponema sp.]|nr:EAL domain-containing protein [Treponema sp.]